MTRHTKMLKEFSLEKNKADFINKIQKSRKAEINANGTSGYKIKRGHECWKNIKHLKKTPENI